MQPLLSACLLSLSLLLPACGAEPAGSLGAEGSYPVRLDLRPLSPPQGVRVLPRPDGGCLPVLEERCLLFSDGREECSVSDAGCW